MSDLIQVRRGTTAQWVAANPVLAVAEPGFDTTTGDFRIGDGVNPWSLLYTVALGALQGNLDTRYVAAPTSWTGVTFTNSWVDYGSGNNACQYRRVGDTVQVRGLMKSGTVGAASFTLPAGYRPPASLIFATNSNGAFGAINIDNAGIFTPLSGSNVYFSINCSFSTVT